MTDYPEGFERVYGLWRRRVGKKDAYKAWSKLSVPERILLERGIRKWNAAKYFWKEIEFIPYFGTFIRSDDWREEPPDERPRNGRVDDRCPPAEEIKANLAKYGPEATRKWLQGLRVDASVMEGLRRENL